MIRSMFGRLCELLKHCQLRLLLIGVILESCVVCSSGQIKPVSCRSDNHTSQYKHCRLALPGGVAGMECFGKFHSQGLITCHWRRGAAREEQAKFTLVIRQKKDRYCRVYKTTEDTLTNIRVFKHNLTVEVLEQIGSECSKDIVTTHYNNLLRCGPPRRVTFRRHSHGWVNVGAQWSPDDAKVITSVCVRHKEVTDHRDYPHRHDDGQWHQTCCQGAAGCHLAGVKGLPVLEVQVACEINDKCSQCPWSHVYTLPPELTSPPLGLHVMENKMADRGGQRIISLTWTFLEGHDGFNVSVAKVSGEPPREVLSVPRPPIRLLLSNSAFQVHVSAFNNVSVSPAANITVMPPRDDDSVSDDGGRLSVRVHNQTTFTVVWKDDLVKKYKCFCLEWSATHGPHPPKLFYKSFYEEVINFWTLFDIPERLRAYTSYDVWLHVRDQQQTCNLKQVNNSQEATYAKARFYFREGSPVSAPSNVSVVSVTSSSLELRWSSISQENRRGFLLGYVIHYAEDRELERSKTQGFISRHITVGLRVHNYTLEGLRSGVAYRVQVSGFTRCGPGIRSAARLVETRRGGSINLAVLLTISTLVLMTAMLVTPLLRSRAKVVFWPNIPNPERSKSMQKLGAPTQPLLQRVETLKLEECIVDRLLVVELRVPPSKCQQSACCRSAAVDEASVVSSHDAPLAAPFSGYTSLDVIQQLMMGKEGALTRKAM
ncbi:interleukin-31 receptor subunit alpha isoform X3 [Hippocampus comes]|uniref:interleukin-31 receptor subunit alpha isoform X3 n=1 Tax=Hippocampus comes TaxID=109280 RepID=UPI00094EF2F5|nr:PREDICTED: interleukin-31 receptor subunit alpha-like isoform X3 [Hippocampus comes]